MQQYEFSAHVQALHLKELFPDPFDKGSLLMTPGHVDVHWGIVSDVSPQYFLQT